MAFAFLIVGSALIITAYRDTYKQLGTLLYNDAAGFLKWAAAITVVGVLGYVPDLRGVGRLLLALILLVIVIKNQGAFDQFRQAFTGAIPSAQVPQQYPLTGTPTVNVNLLGGSGGSSSGATQVLSGIGSAIGQGFSALTTLLG